MTNLPLQITTLGCLFIAVGILSTISHLWKGPLDRWTVPILLVGIISVAGRRLLAAGRKMGSLAGSSLACLSRSRERIKITVGCYATHRAALGSGLFPARAANFNYFQSAQPK